ncbi:hypothetical protein RMCBS344292_02361 [Rhizopus microsporus]|nr:hypothetical protein RMCBS344292_02361 [Rhizopus microsporus]
MRNNLSFSFDEYTNNDSDSNKMQRNTDLLPSTTSNNESFVNDTNRQGTTIQTTETNQSNKIDQTSTVPDHSPETVSWSLSKIVQQYGSQPEILELILLSKIEEDRRRAEEAKLKQKELDYLISNGSICSSSSNIGEDTAYTNNNSRPRLSDPTDALAFYHARFNDGMRRQSSDTILHTKKDYFSLSQTRQLHFPDSAKKKHKNDIYPQTSPYTSVNHNLQLQPLEQLNIARRYSQGGSSSLYRRPLSFSEQGSSQTKVYTRSSRSSSNSSSSSSSNALNISSSLFNPTYTQAFPSDFRQEKALTTTESIKAIDKIPDNTNQELAILNPNMLPIDLKGKQVEGHHRAQSSHSQLSETQHAVNSLSIAEQTFVEKSEIQSEAATTSQVLLHGSTSLATNNAIDVHRNLKLPLPPHPQANQTTIDLLSRTRRKKREMQPITMIIETREFPYKDQYEWKNNGNTVNKNSGRRSIYYKCSNSKLGCSVNKTVTFKENGEYLIKYRGNHIDACKKANS